MIRKLIAVVSLAILLLIALTPLSANLPWAALSPFWFFVSLVLLVSLRPERDECVARPVPFLRVVASRPPPCR